jgi:hypothetical protein
MVSLTPGAPASPRARRARVSPNRLGQGIAAHHKFDSRDYPGFFGRHIVGHAQALPHGATRIGVDARVKPLDPRGNSKAIASEQRDPVIAFQKSDRVDAPGAGDAFGDVRPEVAHNE